MDTDNTDLLKKLLRLTEENNVMLRRIQSRARWGTAFRIFYWLLIIGLSVGAFYFIQPYATAVMNNINEVQNNIDTLQSFIK